MALSSVLFRRSSLEHVRAHPGDTTDSAAGKAIAPDRDPGRSAPQLPRADGKCSPPAGDRRFFFQHPGRHGITTG